MTAAETVEKALEFEHVESHLHPEPSFDPAAHPVPTGREEIWRFTPLPRLRGLLGGAPSQGHLAWTESLPAGVRLTELSTMDALALGGLAAFDRLGALAVAGGGGAMLLDVPAEAVLDEPILIGLHGTDRDTIVWGHVVIRIGAHARATIVLEQTGSTTYDEFTTVLVGDGAHLDLVTLADWDGDAVHAGQHNISIGRDATVRTFEVTLGGDLVRTSTNVDYAGPGGSVEMVGLYFADAGQHMEHRLFVDHTAPKTRSHVVYKGALQGKAAHTVWIGNVLIRKVAEGIETYEENRNLVLSDGAQADSVPNLEIETGEIQGAGHASATGRFDDEQLFYLMARGIPQDEARKLVVRGFFGELITKIPLESLRERLTASIEERLTAAGS